MKWNSSILFLLFVQVPFTEIRANTRKLCSVTYYIDSRHGSDQHKGTDKRFSWKTIAPLRNTALHPGDSICFKRGSAFTGPLYIRYSGHPGHYITLTDYGSKKDPAPAFTNPVFREGNYGNGIRVSGSYVIVEHLFFSKTAAYTAIKYSGGDGWLVWEMGAIHIDKGAEHCIIRNNEIKDCVAGIRSNGEHTLIEHNYIHDCNRVMKQWNWGPLGIWLGADYQEVCYNRIFNYSAADPRIGWGADSYGSGADGGAMEIDDARYDKSNISIHHNYTKDCQGFLEVTWTDVKQNPCYRNFRIHHNVSDDYQQFIALWRGESCYIENNTIIRRKVNANDWGVFNITQRNAQNVIRNNIVVVEKNVVIFNTGKKGAAKPNTIISHNLYYAAADSLNMGKEGPGYSAIIANPLFTHYQYGLKAEDFSITGTSPAVNKGLNLGYEYDFANNCIPENGIPDIGAFEYKEYKNNRIVPVSSITLSQNGKPFFAIYPPSIASVIQNFPAAELSRYLQKICGPVLFFHAIRNKSKSVIILEQNKLLPTEDYLTARQNMFPISRYSAMMRPSPFMNIPRFTYRKLDDIDTRICAVENNVNRLVNFLKKPAGKRYFHSLQTKQYCQTFETL